MKTSSPVPWCKSSWCWRTFSWGSVGLSWGRLPYNSLQFIQVQNLVSVQNLVEETIGKEILQAPSAPATPACCIPLLQASSSGNSSSVVSACHCCKAIYLHTAAAEVEELCLVPQSLMMSRIFVQFVKLPIHINVSE